jgi:predicted nucleotidyltransferase
MGHPLDQEIQGRLDHIEQDEGVRILYACESGSRAWGFPSADSDYDVRFLYVKPTEWYLSVDLEKKRDVIERPLDDMLDLGGWDLRKALRLFHGSNPPLLEWLGSPIVYRECTSSAARMRALASEYYSPRACAYHYLHMARGNFRDYLKGEEVWVKKYLYVLRPLVAIRWLERGLGVVPTEFQVAVEAVVGGSAVKAAIADLVERKRVGAELDRGPRIEAVSRFIEQEMARLDGDLGVSRCPSSSVEPLNELFRAALEEAWP